jgi:hypothetical protein
MNLLISTLSTIMKYNTIDDFMMNLSKSMSSVFSAEKIHLWLTDSVIIVLLFFNILNRIQEYSIQ